MVKDNLQNKSESDGKKANFQKTFTKEKVEKIMDAEHGAWLLTEYDVSRDLVEDIYFMITEDKTFKKSSRFLEDDD